MYTNIHNIIDQSKAETAEVGWGRATARAPTSAALARGTGPTLKSRFTSYDSIYIYIYICTCSTVIIIMIDSCIYCIITST